MSTPTPPNHQAQTFEIRWGNGTTTMVVADGYSINQHPGGTEVILMMDGMVATIVNMNFAMEMRRIDMSAVIEQLRDS